MIKFIYKGTIVANGRPREADGHRHAVVETAEIVV